MYTNGQGILLAMTSIITIQSHTINALNNFTFVQRVGKNKHYFFILCVINIA